MAISPGSESGRDPLAPVGWCVCASVWWWWWGGCKCQARPENLSVFLSLLVGWDTPPAGLGKVARLIRGVRLLE